MRERDYDGDSRGFGGMDRGGPRRRPKSLPADQVVDYKDAEFLKKFITEQGRMLPRRITGATAMQQREIKRAIRRARVLGLLP